MGRSPKTAPWDADDHHSKTQTAVTLRTVSRRTLVLVTFVTSIGVLTAASPAAAQAGAEWLFDEGSGAIAYDSRNGNDGAISGAAWTTGIHGSALSFTNGTTTAVAIPKTAYDGFGNTAYVEAWVYPTGLPSIAGTVFRKRAAYNDWSLELTPAGRVRTYISGYLGTGGTNGWHLFWIESPSPVPLNAWSKLSSWYDGSTLTLKIDDETVATGDVVLPLRWDTPDCPSDGYFANGCYYGTWIGSASYYSISDVDGRYTFSGIIDDVTIATSPDGGVTSITYVALGDSYSSGEGAGLYVTTNNAPACHRSDHAYSRPEHGIPFSPLFPSVNRTFLACSGAETEEVIDRGFVNEPNKDQISQISRMQGLTTDIDMVTISIGGNDVGFGPLLTYCSLMPTCMQNAAWDDPQGRTIKDYWTDAIIEDHQWRFQQTYDVIKAAAGNDASLFVLGYPQVFPSATADQSCPLLQCVRSKPGGTCLPFMSLSPAEQSDLRDLGTALNATIQQAASAVGAHYVSPSLFQGHEVCGPDGAWIWGNQPGQKVEWFHPTSRGQQGFADAIDGYIFRWLWDNRPVNSSGLPTNPDPVFEALAAAPKQTTPTLGELDIEYVGLPPCDGTDAFALGQSARVIGEGFSPSVGVAFRLYAGSGSEVDLGSTTASTAGDFDTQIIFPTDTSLLGPAVVMAAGIGENSGHRLLIGDFVFVDSATADTDFDGHNNICDNCELLSNPGQEDTDADGFGDVCDPCPSDDQNDADQDGMCADIDPCPLDPTNTIDADGSCFNVNGLFTDDFELGSTAAWSAAVP